MSSPSSLKQQSRALSILPTQNENAAPVLYELDGESTEIGSAEDNAIVLAHPSIAPHHLAVRRSHERDYLLVDLVGNWRDRDQSWTQYQLGDAYWCPRHGSFDHLDSRSWCPLCRHRRGSLWLMRPLKPGDSFDLGQTFRATYVIQEVTAANKALTTQESAFPSNAWFEKTRSPRKIMLTEPTASIPISPLPIDDTNLWRWQPAEVPFPVFLHQRVNRLITQHARQNSQREVGGVLLGDVRQDENKQLYLVITHALQAELANETRGQLTFTQETWLKIHQSHEMQYPDKAIVGWYHTHPGWTIFLSPWDLFIHQNFFKQPWQIALVVDPSLDQAGIFVWKGDQIDNPQKPALPFRLAEMDGWRDGSRPRVRIKLTDPAR